MELEASYGYVRGRGALMRQQEHGIPGSASNNEVKEKRERSNAESPRPALANNEQRQHENIWDEHHGCHVEQKARDKTSDNHEGNLPLLRGGFVLHQVMCKGTEAGCGLGPDEPFSRELRSCPGLDDKAMARNFPCGQRFFGRSD